MNKQCFKCHKVKPTEEFYRHPQMADGYLNKCKECAKRDVRERRKDNHEYYVQYDRERNTRPDRIEQRKAYAESAKGKLAGGRAKRKYIQRNPKRRKANLAVNNAIRDGRLKKKPCKVCGSERLVHGHHDDYSRLLDVVWLCPTHHRERHKKLKTEGREPC